MDRENGLSRLRLVGPAIAGENLVLETAQELEGQVSRPLPFTIRLFKRIPMGAGLGGGSADAAAFLNAANFLYDLKLANDELVQSATAVGQTYPSCFTAVRPGRPAWDRPSFRYRPCPRAGASSSSAHRMRFRLARSMRPSTACMARRAPAPRPRAPPRFRRITLSFAVRPVIARAIPDFVGAILRL